jgi:transposase
LVRQRHYLQGRITAVKNKLRRVLADYNADRRDLFTAAGLAHLAAVRLSEADRFVADQLLEEWREHRERLKAITAQLKQFAAKAPTAEAEARAVLRTIPGVGPVTIDVVVSELGDVRRFGSAKRVCSYAGLVPLVRQSAGKSPELGITKRGSPLLRWAVVEAAWRLVRQSGKWRNIYESIKKRRGGKKAIVAVARRLLCVMVALLKSNRSYRLVAA